MSNPRVKRPFAGNAADPSQRQITSFFGPRSSFTPSDETATSLRNGPVLPANVQANLLSVGMRVRKSVPEGYKTSSHSAFKLWSEAMAVKPSSRTSASARAAASRELLPFCGINKVGGLDCQVIHNDDQHSLEEEGVQEDEIELPGLDDVPGLTMSQESTDSITSTRSVRKRFFGDDEAETVQQWMDAPDLIGSRSLTPAGWGSNARPIAVPRSRAAKRADIKNPDQENMVVDEDFEDADFLVFGSGKEMDMSG